MNHPALSDGERRIVALMDELCSKVLQPGEEPIYWLIMEGKASFTDVDLRHAGSAYLLWAGITDLLGSPWGPGSEEACNWMAREVAVDWLRIDHESYESIEEYFESWLAQLQSFVWPRPAAE